MKNKLARLKSAHKTRSKISFGIKHRLTVHKTTMHTYAQLFSPTGDIVASASTFEKSIIDKKNHTGNIETAKIIGKIIAERAIKKNVTEVAFDRSGFNYHGRIKALAESAREHGLKF
jgi:large subunit ribosomal protein L18